LSSGERSKPAASANFSAPHPCALHGRFWEIDDTVAMIEEW
jgi:hypothetical protein